MLSLVAAIPYTTFPTIALGPLNLRTFGFVVASGMAVALDGEAAPAPPVAAD